jgi:hypothetical protein
MLASSMNTEPGHVYVTILKDTKVGGVGVGRRVLDATAVEILSPNTSRFIILLQFLNFVIFKTKIKPLKYKM